MVNSRRGADPTQLTGCSGGSPPEGAPQTPRLFFSFNLIGIYLGLINDTDSFSLKSQRKAVSWKQPVHFDRCYYYYYYLFFLLLTLIECVRSPRDRRFLVALNKRAIATITSRIISSLRSLSVRVRLRGSHLRGLSCTKRSGARKRVLKLPSRLLRAPADSPLKTKLNVFHNSEGADLGNIASSPGAAGYGSTEGVAASETEPSRLG